jgi:hypothetical protein
MQREEIDQMLHFAELLLERTRRGEVQWLVTDDEGTFLYSGAKSGLLIEGIPYDEDDPYAGEFSLKLVNGKGQVVADLNNEAETEEESPLTRMLADLYFAVRENTLEIKNTFADMSESLGVTDVNKPPNRSS